MTDKIIVNGEVVIHKGTPDGRKVGEEYTITSDLVYRKYGSLSGHRGEGWGYYIDGEPDEGYFIVMAAQEWLQKKYPPSTESWKEMMSNLTTINEYVE